jgi:DNA (cytosine-5)-methyltransferase 1
MNDKALLDLFSCSGGATRGYARAGFTQFVGVDILPMPKYPCEFWQMDALDVLKKLIAGDTINGWTLNDFDAIHTSPPCQGFSQLSIARGDGTQDKYLNLIPETRELCIATGKPYIIENIERAPMLDSAVLLCGTQFGGQYMWHRKFECNFPVKKLTCNHARETTYASPFTMPNYWRIQKDFGPVPNPEKRFRKMKGIDWTENQKEGREALPPVYTEYIGNELVRYLNEWS